MAMAHIARYCIQTQPATADGDNINMIDRNSPDPGVVVVVLGRHFSCGVVIYAPLIPGIELIFLPLFGSTNMRMLQLINVQLQTWRTFAYR